MQKSKASAASQSRRLPSASASNKASAAAAKKGAARKSAKPSDLNEEAKHLSKKGATAAKQSTSRKSGKRLDFDEEAKRLWADKKVKKAPSNDLDAIWTHPSGGAIYVGNYKAAASLEQLTSHNITRVSVAFIAKLNLLKVVNCTSGGRALPNSHMAVLKYLTFPVHYHLRSNFVMVLLRSASGTNSSERVTEAFKV